jgi:hypothetical protein
MRRHVSLAILPKVNSMISKANWVRSSRFPISLPTCVSKYKTNPIRRRGSVYPADLIRSLARHPQDESPLRSIPASVGVYRAAKIVSPDFKRAASTGRGKV